LEFAVDGVIAAKPDLVTIAGDLVQHPRVSIWAVRALLKGIRRMSEETGAEIIICQGNHDSARTPDVLTPIVIPEDIPRVHVITTPQRVRFTTRNGEAVAVAVFPFSVKEGYSEFRVEPDPKADLNVLLIHAAVKGDAGADLTPYFYHSGESLDVGRAADDFDVIACGDYHEFTRLHPTRLAFYSGAIERTTTNVWQEHEPKGWVLYDTATGTMEFQEVPTRAMYNYDLGDFDLLPGAKALETNVCLNILTENEDLKDAMVRFKVDDFPREEKQHLDWATVRVLRHRCLCFDLDLRYAKRELADLGDQRDRGPMTMAQEAVAFFEEDSPEVRALAFKHLDIEASVEEVEA
jgi:DNA repair exonuclease SbcCD nuclease subunit